MYSFLWYFSKLNHTARHKAKSKTYKVNPFTAPACKISGQKNAWMLLQTVYFPFLASILIKFLSHARAKRKTERPFRVSNCAL